MILYVILCAYLPPDIPIESHSGPTFPIALCTGCRRIDLATRCKGCVFRSLFLLMFPTETPKFAENFEVGQLKLGNLGFKGPKYLILY